jgi:hypothetical protein
MGHGAKWRDVPRGKAVVCSAPGGAWWEKAGSGVGIGGSGLDSFAPFGCAQRNIFFILALGPISVVHILLTLEPPLRVTRGGDSRDPRG